MLSTTFVPFPTARAQQKHSPAPRWHTHAVEDPTFPAARYSEPLFKVALKKPKFKLSQSDHFFTMGSCFARGLESALANLNLRVLSLTDEFDQFRVNGEAVNPRGLTNKYNLGAISNEIAWGTGARQFPEAAFVELDNNVFADPHLTPIFEPASADEVRARRAVMTRTSARITEADVVVLTLGLIEVWLDQVTGLITNTTPFHAFRRYPDRFTFGRLNYADNTAMIEQAHQLLREFGRPNHRIIVTVSPVPLEATFTDTDVVEASSYSKSLLRVIAQEFADRHSNVEYFPSYEIVMNSRRSEAWEPDHRHVRPTAADFVMRNFIGHYMDIDEDVTLVRESLG